MIFSRLIMGAVAALCWCGAAQAGCTTAVTVTNVSTQVLVANDLVTTTRAVLFLQNTGATNTAYCAIGTSNAATTTNGFEVMPSGYLMLPTVSTPSNQPGVEIMHAPPQNDVACITAAGSTSVVLCDY